MRAYIVRSDHVSGNAGMKRACAGVHSCYSVDDRTCMRECACMSV